MHAASTWLSDERGKEGVRCLARHYSPLSAATGWQSSATTGVLPVLLLLRLVTSVLLPGSPLLLLVSAPLRGALTCVPVGSKMMASFKAPLYLYVRCLERETNGLALQ